MALALCTVVTQWLAGERVVRMECMMLSNDGPQLRVMVILFQTGGGPLFLRRQRLHKLYTYANIYLQTYDLLAKKLSFSGSSSPFRVV